MNIDLSTFDNSWYNPEGDTFNTIHLVFYQHSIF